MRVLEGVYTRDSHHGKGCGRHRQAGCAMQGKKRKDGDSEMCNEVTVVNSLNKKRILNLLMLLFFSYLRHRYHHHHHIHIYLHFHIHHSHTRIYHYRYFHFHHHQIMFFFSIFSSCNRKRQDNHDDKI